MTGVLVCDDAPDIRALLRDALDADPALRVVGEAADGTAALRLAEALQPDVVLLDIAMPGPDAGTVVTGVRRAAPDAAIVVLSGFGPEHLDRRPRARSPRTCRRRRTSPRCGRRCAPPARGSRR